MLREEEGRLRQIHAQFNDIYRHQLEFIQLVDELVNELDGSKV